LKPLFEAVAQFNVTNRSSTDPDFKVPKELHPWVEMTFSVNDTFGRLATDQQERPDSENFKRAKQTEYWDGALKYRNNWDNLKQAIAPQSGEIVGTTNVSRRLRSLGTVTPGDKEGHYRVHISADDATRPAGRPFPQGHPHRRLLEDHIERRLFDWDVDAEITPEKLDIAVDLGKVNTALTLHTCNTVDGLATRTNWGACQTGRVGPGQIVKAEGYASGSQIVLPWPTISLEAGGGLVYDDTSPLECVGARLRIRNVDTDDLLRDTGGSIGLSDEWDEEEEIWEVADCGDSLPIMRLDVCIKSYRNLHLTDNEGNTASVTSNEQWWRILDAGDGEVFIRSEKNGAAPRYLWVDDDKVSTTTNLRENDERWRWEILNEDEDSVCGFGDFKGYGLMTFKKEMDLILGLSLSFTTEIGAAASIHRKHGPYISEVYGKGIAEISDLEVHFVASMAPTDPWEFDYKLWELCFSAGYELDTWLFTYRGDYTILCVDLNFR